MQVKWSQVAVGDLGRLHEFLRIASPPAAKAVVDRLKQAPRMLQAQPQMGKPLTEFEPREVRRIVVGDYEMRYEVQAETIFILRIWHSRENR
jgi:plasmid stabilization system protein ParE